MRVVPSRLKCSVTNSGVSNDMHVTIDPRPVEPVNHCFTTCTGRASRTSRVKPFTGRIRSTVLDKDVENWTKCRRGKMKCVFKLTCLSVNHAKSFKKVSDVVQNGLDDLSRAASYLTTFLHISVTRTLSTTAKMINVNS